MRLDKIKLSGFKSFVDPASVHFPSNLTGIVGPNGCGKSNIIDAVRWVLGESSARQLRGESLDDVIFNGSQARKPVGQASVELLFENNGTVQGQYSSYAEIAIRRVLARDGQSHYYLNGTRCRRRDITDIFLGTGLGPRSYAIIEQNMVTRLIEANPDELRVFIEEAAGISRYKDRRKETVHRIEDARENLARVNDLRSELDKQLTHLRRQAANAEKYQNLQQERQQLQHELLALHWSMLDRKLAEETLKINVLSADLEDSLSAQQARLKTLEMKREALAAADVRTDTAQSEHYAMHGELAHSEQLYRHAREAHERCANDLGQAEIALGEVQQQQQENVHKQLEADRMMAEIQPLCAAAEAAAAETAVELQRAEQAMQDWQTQWDDCIRRHAALTQDSEVERTRCFHIEQHLERLRERHARLQQEMQTLEADTDTLNGTVDSLTQDDVEAQSDGLRLHRLQQELTQRLAAFGAEAESRQHDLNGRRAQAQNARARLVSLQTLQRAALEKDAPNAAAWLRLHGLAQVPRVAQQISVQSGWEHALEMALGAHLEAVCTDDTAALSQPLNELDQGSICLLDAKAAVAGCEKTTILPTLFSKVESVLPMQSLLAGIYCAPTVQDALQQRHALAAHESIITSDGLWLGANWLRIERGNDEHHGVLLREKEIKALELEVESYSAEISAAEHDLAEVMQALRATEHERDQVQQEFALFQSRQIDIQSKLSSGRAQLTRNAARYEALLAEVSELALQQTKDESDLASAQQHLQHATIALPVVLAEREQLDQQREQLRGNLHERRAHAQARREATHDLALKRQSSLALGCSLTEHRTHLQEQVMALGARLEHATAALAALAPLHEFEQQQRSLIERCRHADEQLEQARAVRAALTADVHALDEQRTSGDGDVEARRAQLEEQRLTCQALDVRRTLLQEQAAPQGVDLPTVLAALPANTEEAAWQAKLNALEQRIQRLGLINLAAIEECTEVEERKGYLDRQHADLAEALTTLENAMRAMDKETRASFKETFDKVNANLQALFPRLFGGGQAHLELIDNDVLNGGVAIMVRPPGKRISTIHILSGGEKALAAVALVFAIFELNPAPFCMLDEVDAPLDDINVGRFCALVAEISQRVQLIFITHNKATMELTDRLIGVTMQEPGISRLVTVDMEAALRFAAG